MGDLFVSAQRNTRTVHPEQRMPRDTLPPQVSNQSASSVDGLKVAKTRTDKKKEGR